MFQFDLLFKIATFICINLSFWNIILNRRKICIYNNLFYFLFITLLFLFATKKGGFLFRGLLTFKNMNPKVCLCCLHLLHLKSLLPLSPTTKIFYLVFSTGNFGNFKHSTNKLPPYRRNNWFTMKITISIFKNVKFCKYTLASLHLYVNYSHRNYLSKFFRKLWSRFYFEFNCWFDFGFQNTKLT